MPEFLSLCACRGAKPRNLKAQKTHARDHLVTKLMSQRNVLRYVCAPKGFGKSILASQYAELVFSFKDVFWINCQSPCFIRDLDSRELLNELFELCRKPKLVVFDDYENIDDSRAVKFSNLINVLLEKSVEVIVISSPDNDGFLQGHPDCLTLTANDLLLGEQECANSSENIINRIPVVAWNSEYPIVELLKCAISENLPDAVKFALFYEYLNGSGSIKLLEKYLSKSEVKLLKELDEKYLFFGLSSDANEFTVPDINFSKLISVFAAYSSSFQNITKTKNKSKFLEQIINDLEEKNKNKKIIEVAICSAVNSLRLSCFNKYKDWLIENFELSLLIKLYKKLHLSDSNLGTESIYYAFSMGVLGHTKEAIKVAFNVLDNDFSTIENKLLSALIFMRYGSDNEKLRALKLIRYIYDDFKIDNYLDNKNLSDNVKDEFKLISNLININLAIFHETKDPFRLWLDQVEQKVSNRDLLCAENIFALYKYINKSFFAGESYLKFIQILSKAEKLQP